MPSTSPRLFLQLLHVHNTCQPPPNISPALGSRPSCPLSVICRKAQTSGPKAVPTLSQRLAFPHQVQLPTNQHLLNPLPNSTHPLQTTNSTLKSILKAPQDEKLGPCKLISQPKQHKEPPRNLPHFLVLVTQTSRNVSGEKTLEASSRELTRSRGRPTDPSPRVVHRLANVPVSDPGRMTNPLSPEGCAGAAGISAPYRGRSFRTVGVQRPQQAAASCSGWIGLVAGGSCAVGCGIWWLLGSHCYRPGR